jgi:aspartyl protease family protein
MRSLLAISLIIAVAAVASPRLLTRFVGEGTDGPGTGVAESSLSEPSGAAAAQALSEGRQVSIEAAGDGHFYVDAEINSRPVRLVVDTGATVVALRQSDAEAAGIRPRPGEFDRPVGTANGTAFAAEAELERVSVRDIEVEGVRALILPDDKLAISLLGGSFLNRLARFHVENGTLAFEN